MDGGNCNIPLLFLKKCGDKNHSYTSMKTFFVIPIGSNLNFVNLDFCYYLEYAVVSYFTFYGYDTDCKTFIYSSV